MYTFHLQWDNCLFNLVNPLFNLCHKRWDQKHSIRCSFFSTAPFKLLLKKNYENTANPQVTLLEKPQENMDIFINLAQARFKGYLCESDLLLQSFICGIFISNWLAIGDFWQAIASKFAKPHLKPLDPRIFNSKIFFYLSDWTLCSEAEEKLDKNLVEQFQLKFLHGYLSGFISPVKPQTKQ